MFQDKTATSSRLRRRAIHKNCRIKSTNLKFCTHALCAENPLVKCEQVAGLGCVDFGTMALPETEVAYRDCLCVAIKGKRQSKPANHPSDEQGKGFRAHFVTEGKEGPPPCYVRSRYNYYKKRCNKFACTQHPLTKCERELEVWSGGAVWGRCSHFNTFNLPQTKEVCAGCSCATEIDSETLSRRRKQRLAMHGS